MPMPRDPLALAECRENCGSSPPWIERGKLGQLRGPVSVESGHTGPSFHEVRGVGCAQIVVESTAPTEVSGALLQFAMRIQWVRGE